MTPPPEGPTEIQKAEERLLKAHDLVVQASEKMGESAERVRILEEIRDTLDEYLKECSMPEEGSAVVEFASILSSRISSRPLTK